jgi:hypothetical protein
MEPQLYMWSGKRRRIIDRHNFYVEQVRTKVLAQFRNIEAEAEASLIISTMSLRLYQPAKSRGCSNASSS